MGLKFQHGALFDLDGVLVDTEGIYTDFWRQIDRLFPTGVKDFALVIKGNTLSRILDTYFPAEQHPAIKELLRKQEDEMKYKLFPGVLEMLAEIKTAGWGIAIVTSSNNTKMEHLFEQIPRLGEMIDILVTDGDVTHSKPDPEGYLLAAQRLGCDPQNCIVFEDSLAGIEAGRRSGATVVAVATTNPRSVIEPLNDIVVNIVSEFKFNHL